MKHSFLIFAYLWILTPVFSQTNFSQPAISPDGHWLAFIGDQNGNDDLYLSRQDGSDVRCLSAEPGTEAHPRWSPDGQWLLFNIFSKKDDQPSDVYIRNPWTKEQINLTQGKFPDGQACDWHPNGRSLLFSAGPFPGINIYQYELKSGEVRPLTSEEKKISYYASYAPNGKSILYSVFSRSDKGIYQINKNGGSPKKLIDQGEAASWSPKGRSFVFQKKEGDRYLLFIYDLKTKTYRPLLGEKSTQGQAPCWSPDGRSVFFHRDMDGQKSLLRLDLKSGHESAIFLRM